MKIPLDPTTGPKMSDFSSKNPCTWCDGCGDFGIWAAVKRALVELGTAPHDAMLCYDVGCHGNMSDKLEAYRFHGMHGRVLPFASGAKLANMNMPVIAHGGDGASFSEGVNHLVHTVRSNYPFVFLLHNNANYGLTTGQASSLTWQDQPMNCSPNGIPERTLQSMDFVFSLQPTFVARTFSGDIEQMTEVLKAAIAHDGFAFVDILQACPTYNKFMTHEWLMERVYDVAKEGHDTSDFVKSRALAIDTSERIATGVLYQNTEVPSFHDRLVPRKGKKTVLTEEVQKVDVTEFMKELV